MSFFFLIFKKKKKLSQISFQKSSLSSNLKISNIIRSLYTVLALFSYLPSYKPTYINY